MAYEQILSQYANINNVGTLWAQIVANFIHAAPAAKGDILFWNAASQGGVGNTPTQPSHLTIGSPGDFLSVNNGVPVWTAFGTPSLAFSDTTTNAPKLAITIQGKTSTPVALPVADATHSGILTIGAQTIAGAKTFKETVHSEKDVEADGGVSAYGIADLSMGGGGGTGTVIGITYGNVTLQTTYTPVDGIVTLPKSADNITWTSTNQSLTQTQKTNLLALYDRAPSALWNSGNEIADKSFVNSSIATATATFRGTVTATDDTDAAAATALATISTKDDNDYAFVKVENTPQTGVDKFKRYKYNGSAWVYEYTLNNSSFTSDQWNSINSGITTSLVTDIGTLKSYFNMSAGKALKAVEADKFSSARTIALTGNVTGSVSSTGESGWSIATTIANGAVTNDMLAGSIANAKLVNSKVTIAGTDVSLGGSITAAQLQTNLGLGGAAYKAADYYVNSISWDSTNKKLAWSKGGTAQNAITIGYATDSDTVDEHHASEFVGALGVSGDYLTWTRIGGTAQNITIPYATNANHALSSDKLTTARTIWGQTFDGTANVSGAMSDVTNIDSLIYISSSKVGIDISSPTVKLDIAGGLKTTEDISGGQDIYAAGGMAAYGIADLAMGGGGGTGTVIAIKFEGSSTQYNPVDGIVTLPAYPSLIGYATQNWVSSQITALNLGTASTHAHSDYLTDITWDSTNRILKKTHGGDESATNLVTFGSVYSHAHSEYLTALGVDGDNLSYTKGSGSAVALTVPYATTALDAKTELQSGQEFAFRQTSGGTLTRPYSSGVLKRVLGNTVVWNQQFVPFSTSSVINKASGSPTISYSNGEASITCSSSSSGSQNRLYFNDKYPTNGHIYYTGFWIKSAVASSIVFALNDTAKTGTISVGASYTKVAILGTATGNNSPIWWDMRTTSSSGCTQVIKDRFLIDVTLFFNGNIPANYTAADFERDYGYLLANPEYNAGTLINNACSGLETVGFNLFDTSTLVLGKYRNPSGQESQSSADATRRCSDVYYKCQPNCNYYAYCTEFNTSNFNVVVCWYDGNKNFISGVNTQSGAITSPNNATYFRVSSVLQSGDICINLSNTSKNGTYEPYRKNILPLRLNSFRVKDANGNITTINGLKKAGTVQDEIVGKRFIRRIGVIQDMSTLTWAKGSTYNSYITGKKYGYKNLRTPIFITTPGTEGISVAAGYISGGGASNGIWLNLSTASSIENLLTLLSGIPLYYELDTPIEYEIIDDFPTSYPIDVLGTEGIPEGEMVAPFVADIQYGAKQNDFAWDIDHLASKVADMDISHYSSLSDSTKDAHVITIGGKKLYLKFRATQADATTNPQTLPAFELAVADNAEGQNEQVFSFGTITEDWITTNCVLPS